MYLYELGIKDFDKSGTMVGLKLSRRISNDEFRIMVEKIIAQIKGDITKGDINLVTKILCDKFGFKIAYGNEIFQMEYASQYIYDPPEEIVTLP